MPMGDVSPNNGGPWYHTNDEGTVLGIRAGGFHFTPDTGQTWQAPPEISVAAYTSIWNANEQGAAALNAAILGSAWGPWWTQFVAPVQQRVATWRRLIKLLPPRSSVADVGLVA